MIATNGGIELAKAADRELQKQVRNLEQYNASTFEGQTTSEILLRSVKAWMETRSIAAKAPHWMSDDAAPPGVYAAGS